jgi:hypothetical protein
MRERRSSERYVLKVPGYIVINGTAHPCIIYDKSKTGARLIRFGNIPLPQQFAIQVEGTVQQCWLIWQMDREAGVAFSEPERNEQGTN